jgi:hypothetical protein
MNNRFLNFMLRLSPCSTAVRLASDATERKLLFREQLALKLHLAICSACRSYRHSVTVIRQAMRMAKGTGASDGTATLPDDAKARILSKIRIA